MGLFFHQVGGISHWWLRNALDDVDSEEFGVLDKSIYGMIIEVGCKWEGVRPTDGGFERRGRWLP